MSTVILIGSGAREHAIAQALSASPQKPKLVVFGSSQNPGIRALSSAYEVGQITDADAVASFAKRHHADLAIVGPEAPLASGVADLLNTAKIPTVGPEKKLAQVESSKGFTRDLFQKHKIAGSPAYRRFTDLKGVEEFLEELGQQYVVKADGLMGGKGVKVAEEHLDSPDEALAWCREILESGSPFVIEEKCVGPEFSLFTFTDGKEVLHSPLVQDHKRAYENDTGPNTGGMGSYSLPDHRLPFVNPVDYQAAAKMNELALEALASECGSRYRGILYGGFMVTKDGIRLIEYNARFGDPECMNLLSLLEGDFLEMASGLACGSFQPSAYRFRKLSSVCKYLVPEGYPDEPKKMFPIDISAVPQGAKMFLGAVDEVESQLLATGSRTLAFVGIGKTLVEAESKAEDLVKTVQGPLFHRADIGKEKLLLKRMKLYQSIRSQ